MRDCSQWENSTREYTEETRGQFQWNLEPKKDGTTIDPTVYSTPSKKVFHKLKVGTLTPDMVTLYDVCENMIKPQTGDLKCSLVELYAGAASR